MSIDAHSSAPPQRHGAKTVSVTLPARRAFVTRDAVAAVLTKSPTASLRKVREALGGGSLADISEVVAAVRGKRVVALRDALQDGPDLGGRVVDVIEQLASQMAQLQATVDAQYRASQRRAPTASDMDTIVSALERAEARWAQRLASVTAAIAEVKHLATMERSVPPAPEPFLDKTVATMLHAIEGRLLSLTQVVDADRREPAVPISPPAVPAEAEALRRQVHRLTQTVDAQFGLVRRVAHAAETPSPDLAALGGEVRAIGKQVARIARRTAATAPTSTALSPAASASIAPGGAVTIRAAARRTATSTTASRTPMSLRQRAKRKRQPVAAARRAAASPKRGRAATKPASRRAAPATGRRPQPAATPTPRAAQTVRRSQPPTKSAHSRRPVASKPSSRIKREPAGVAPKSRPKAPGAQKQGAAPKRYSAAKPARSPRRPRSLGRRR